MEECKAAMIPFEALLQPSQLMPFSLILETCLANSNAPPTQGDLCKMLHMLGVLSHEMICP